MSGFSADWLALREPADHAARNTDVLAQVTKHFAGRDHLSIVDLGCGAGSNLRGCALSLPATHQNWTLVDYDPALLAIARERLAAWADTAEEFGEELMLEKDGKTIAVDMRQADLNTDVERIAGWRPDLVAAAALFDLVSPAWIERFVAALAQRKLPLYTVLIYDGREEWSPPHAQDAAVHSAFLAHQRRDKGFGPSAGSEAGPVMRDAFERAGYHIATGDSPWILSRGDAVLARELISGIAGAAEETGDVSSADAQAWADFRRSVANRAEASGRVGHLDLWATP